MSSQCSFYSNSSSLTPENFHMLDPVHPKEEIF